MRLFLLAWFSFFAGMLVAGAIVAWSESRERKRRKPLVNRYLAFAFMGHEEGGGWNDFKGDFATIEEAKSARIAHGRHDDWESFHVVDLLTRSIVLESFWPEWQKEPDWKIRPMKVWPPL